MSDSTNVTVSVTDPKTGILHSATVDSVQWKKIDEWYKSRQSPYATLFQEFKPQPNTNNVPSMILDYDKDATYTDGQMIRFKVKDRPITSVFVYNSKLHTFETIQQMIQGRNAKSIHDYL